jgi:hypothetical protein
MIAPIMSGFARWNLDPDQGFALFFKKSKQKDTRKGVEWLRAVPCKGPMSLDKSMLQMDGKAIKLLPQNSVGFVILRTFLK